MVPIRIYISLYRERSEIRGIYTPVTVGTECSLSAAIYVVSPVPMHVSKAESILRNFRSTEIMRISLILLWLTAQCRGKDSNSQI